jgi:hypothetical protein
MDWKRGLSGRVPALQVQSPESHQKKRKRKSNRGGEWVSMLKVYYMHVMSMAVLISLSHTNFFPFGYILSHGLAGLYCNSIFGFWKTFHTILHNDWTNTHFHSQCTQVLFFLHPRQQNPFDFVNINYKYELALNSASLVHMLVFMLMLCYFSWLQLCNIFWNQVI